MSCKYIIDDKNIKGSIYTHIDEVEEIFREVGLDTIVKNVTGKRSDKVVSLVRKNEQGVEKYQLEIIEFFSDNKETEEFKSMIPILGVYCTAALYGTYKKRLTVVDIDPTPFQEFNLKCSFPISFRDYLMMEEKDIEEPPYNEDTDITLKYSYRRIKFESALYTCSCCIPTSN